jgi:hypothetical protein
MSQRCQKPTSGRGRHTAAQPDGKRDQQQARQRKPDNRISHVIVGQMHLKRPGFRDAARKHWSLQIDVERRNPIPPERLRHREMIPGEPQPLRVLYFGPEQAGCHGKMQVAGQRDGLVGDELRYRELDDALGLTALAGDVLADARTGKNGRMLWQSVFGRLAGYKNVNDAERLRHDPAMRWIVGGKAPQGRAASPSQMGR